MDADGAVKALRPEPTVAPIAPVSAPVATLPPLIAEPAAPVAAPTIAFAIGVGMLPDIALLAWPPNELNALLIAAFDNTAFGSAPPAIALVAAKRADATGVLIGALKPI